jgi:hypothetical protein
MILTSNRGSTPSSQIEGSSYRLRQHADLVPGHLRATALITVVALEIGRVIEEEGQRVVDFDRREMLAGAFVGNARRAARIIGPRLPYNASPRN